ncbi:MAG: hypothetical protein QMC80_03035 [Thermoplasmatales archaeon]|nr:hypothetical protein [Thermoplasmatales archaeon]
MKLKIKTSKTFIVTTVIIAIIAGMVCAVLFEWVDVGNVFEWIKWFIFSAFFVIVLALLGAIFLGLFLGHRILSIGSFTPFEKSMLEMKEDIKKIDEKLEKIEKKLNK